MVIPKEQLIPSCYYFGEGRFVGGLGLWDGKVFHGFQYKFGQYLQTSAVYGMRGFDPLSLIEIPDETQSE